MRDGSWRRWRRILWRNPADDVNDELDHHVEERIRDYIARGMDPESARGAARERLGDLDRVRDECTRMLTGERRARDRRILLNVSLLDVKLGLRMLAKYPGLSLVAVLGMAVAIAIGAGAFAIIDAMLDPTLPFDEGDRIVTIQNNRADEPGNPERRALHDFVMWREELESVQDLGAFRTGSRNLIADNGTALVRVAEMSAAGFRITRVLPVEGRYFAEDDEREGAPAVLVIAHEEWQRRFDGDPDIIGRTVRLGATPHTIIGVMPEGFRFPFAHRYWVPLRLDPSDYARGSGPSIDMFGRLADGVSLRRAQAELTAIGQRMSAAYPETHRYRRPRVMHYTHAAFDVDSPQVALAFRALQLAIGMLLVVVALNVAILVYARTTTRAGEIAVRSALGASRRRVVAQLFVEALVLTGAASVVGLAIAAAALATLDGLLRRFVDDLPFWVDIGLSVGSVVYVVGLALVGAAIVGVLPALRATGRHVQAGLQHLSARGSQMQLGRVWTALIVAQVGITVAMLPAATFWPGAMLAVGSADPGYPAEEFLRARLSMDRDGSAPDAEVLANRAADLHRRLDAEPGMDASFAIRFPGVEEPPARIEMEGVAQPPGVLVNHVGPDLFDAFDVPIVAGRAFVDADTRQGSSVIVDQMFVDRVAGGANVVGRYVRYVQRYDSRDAEPGPWLEIVGVVPAFVPPTLPPPFNEPEPRIYHAAAPAQDGATLLIVRIRNRAATEFAGALRSITATVDPALLLNQLTTGSRHELRQWLRAFALGITLVTLSVLLLSAAGVYAMMSFTVARRRREIGIRSALGADPRRILTSIFARAGAQLGAGVLLGLLFAIALEWGSDGRFMGGRPFFVLPSVALIILMVGLLAALGPARRGLAIQPTEALREE
jgi:predicted permease